MIGIPKAISFAEVSISKRLITNPKTNNANEENILLLFLAKKTPIDKYMVATHNFF